ncbi:HtaA domain-containing protein [Microbacterium oxydans]|nr:HtaA domain-containing protein [Microbacterium oxydans]
MGNGAGSLDDESLAGLITFGGSITFTGHDGALNTTLANAAVELAGDKGYLVFDVTGTTQGGESIDQKGVRLAEFALGDAAVVDGALTLDAIPTTLTEAGASAFGTYAAGRSSIRSRLSSRSARTAASRRRSRNPTRRRLRW